MVEKWELRWPWATGVICNVFIDNFTHNLKLTTIFIPLRDKSASVQCATIGGKQCNSHFESL